MKFSLWWDLSPKKMQDITELQSVIDNSYMGEISPAVDNLIKRNFHADKPNERWFTDITELYIPAGKIFLSPTIDCFDGLPVV